MSNQNPPPSPLLSMALQMSHDAELLPPATPNTSAFSSTYTTSDSASAAQVHLEFHAQARSALASGPLPTLPLLPSKFCLDLPLTVYLKCPHSSSGTLSPPVRTVVLGSRALSTFRLFILSAFCVPTPAKGGPAPAPLLQMQEQGSLLMSLVLAHRGHFTIFIE